MKLSVSREAVPLPIAIISTLYLANNLNTVFSLLTKASGLTVAPLLNSFGNILSFSKNLPVWSITANLQPVLNAGSTPKTILPLSGACNNKFLRFKPKMLIACSSAFSFSSALFSHL